MNEGPIICSACGQSNPASFRFCQNCGARLVAVGEAGSAQEGSPEETTKLLEQAKAQCESGQDEQALAMLTEAVRRAPENAECHAWLGWVYGGLNRTDEALREAQTALRLDPCCAIAHYVLGMDAEDRCDYDGAIASLTRAINSDPGLGGAYRHRGYVHSIKGDYARAIADLTQAIELDPKDAWTYRERSYAYRDSANIEKYLEDSAHFHQLEDPGRYSNPKAQDWDWVLRYVHSHLMSVALPALRATGERLVDYYPTYLRWGYKVEQRIHNGTSSQVHVGTKGVGYVCITEHGLRLWSLGQASTHRKMRPSLLVRALGAAVGAYDFQGVEKQDKSWTIPYSEVTGVHRRDRDVVVATVCETWELGLTNNVHVDAVLTGVRMGKAGRFEHLWDPPKPSPGPNGDAPSGREDTIALLAKLKELVDAGALTPDEYEAKKKELLARL